MTLRNSQYFLFMRVNRISSFLVLFVLFCFLLLFCFNFCICSVLLSLVSLCFIPFALFFSVLSCFVFSYFVCFDTYLGLSNCNYFAKTLDFSCSCPNVFYVWVFINSMKRLTGIFSQNCTFKGCLHFSSKIFTKINIYDGM